jgi:hypothetical protein
VLGKYGTLRYYTAIAPLGPGVAYRERGRLEQRHVGEAEEKARPQEHVIRRGIHHAARCQPKYLAECVESRSEPRRTGPRR